MPKTSIEIPEGVDLSGVDVEKLFSTFLKSRVSGQARDKAVREATKRVIKAHQAEYDRYMKELMPK